MADVNRELRYILDWSEASPTYCESIIRKISSFVSFSIFDVSPDMFGVWITNIPTVDMYVKLRRAFKELV